MTDTPAFDYSKTLYLPQTPFPMRAGLPQKEPEILQHWQKIGLYNRLRETAAGRPRFTLHDGPPYANGNIHIGHALNKILKDMVTRSQQMLGHDSNYVPGWDCHGLPIEWKIEEQYRARGAQKPDFADPVAINAFRQECRAFAEKWVDVQREEFKRLGVTGDWDNPYLTMTYAAEAQIAREIMKFAENDQLYRGSKPVMWSVVEQTALAEAEVEYLDYQSDTVFVAFPVKAPVSKGRIPIGGNQQIMSDSEANLQASVEALISASIVIWTTTPWTIPGNRAISYSSRIAYGLYEVTANERDFGPKVGEKYIIASKLADTVAAAAKITLQRLRDVSADILSHLTCDHPLASLGYDFEVPLLDGDHITDDAGTGFVHTAPGHGREDFDIWMASGKMLTDRGIDTGIPYTVDADGRFTKYAPGFTGAQVITDKGEKGDANQKVIEALIAAGKLVARGRLKHQYPHSWRSKKPVIFRNTPQWFIAMDKPIGAKPLPGEERSTPQASGEGESLAEGHAGAGFDADSPSPASLREATSPHRGEVARRAASTLSDNPQNAGKPLPGGERSTPQAAGEGGGVPRNEPDTLRNRALAAIKATQWVPASGENRINGMIANRPDWVVSRQRAWGVPITVFVHKGTSEVLKDDRVNAAIAGAFEAEGADAWFASKDGARFLTPFGHDPADFDKVNDVLDVWFDSGSTHSYVLDDEKHFPGLYGHRRVADGGPDKVMYLEGSDQHRGWFHSSLLESAGTRGKAPFDVVLTHGFVLDEKGQKMSKSLGNVVAPQTVMEKSGADILRLWVAASDYSDDLRIGPEVLKNFEETYRKLRNTIRWMLGALVHFDGKAVAVADMPDLERLMLGKLADIDPIIREAYASYDYKKVVSTLSNFMNVELSAFYFDIRKDALYCEPASSPKRRAALSVIDITLDAVLKWLAPILVFTTEEAWVLRHGDQASVHLQQMPRIDPDWFSGKRSDRWNKIRAVRSIVTGALEIERSAKRLGSSLEAAPVVYLSGDDRLLEAIRSVDFAEVCITSGIEIVEGQGPQEAFRSADLLNVAVVPARVPAGWIKCARSWKYFDPAAADRDYPDITPRDAQAMRELAR